MLLSLDNRKIYFDLAGPQNAPVVCFTHSLNADGGMWVEQMVPLLGAGYRVLRLDMRGHGGSAPVDGTTGVLGTEPASPNSFIVSCLGLSCTEYSSGARGLAAETSGSTWNVM